MERIKKIGMTIWLTGMLVSMMLGGLNLSAYAVAGENILRPSGVPITGLKASSTNGGYVAANTVDGITTSDTNAWIPTSQANQWIQFDLGSSKEFNMLNIYQFRRLIVDYTVSVTDTVDGGGVGTNWIDIYHNSSPTGGTTNVTLSAVFGDYTAKGRYVRILFDKYGTNGGYRIKEVELQYDSSIDATLKSATYSVNNGINALPAQTVPVVAAINATVAVISDIPSGTSVDTFNSSITKDTNATVTVKDELGNTITGAAQITNNCTATVTNGGVTKVYSLDVLSAIDVRVTSSKYTVDDFNSTITNVPYSDRAVDAFKSNITAPADGSFKVYLSDGTTEVTSGNILTGYKLVTTGQDEISHKTYTITLLAASTSTLLTSATCKIDNTNSQIIMPEVYAVSEETFRANIIAPAYGSYTITEPDGTTALALPIKTGDKVNVTAEDGTTTKTYTVYINIAPGKTYFSSTSASVSYQAPRAFDGDEATRWASAASVTDPQWIKVDFGAPRTFNTVTMTERSPYYIIGYKIQYSNDNSIWSDAYTGTSIGLKSTIRFTTVAARYFRLYFSELAGSPSIYECQIFREPVFTDVEAVALDGSILSMLINSSPLITSNLPLTGENGSTISWTSSNTVAITNQGIVTRPWYDDSEASVSLTAHIVKNAEAQDFQYDVTVPKLPFCTLDTPVLSVADSQATVSVNITKNSSQADAPVIIAALFNTTTGEMENVRITNSQLSRGETGTETVVCPLPLDTTGKKLRVFIWKSLADLSPLTLVNEFTTFQ